MTGPTQHPASNSEGRKKAARQKQGGMKWGDDLVRDCQELRRLEAWGLYARGNHDRTCPIDHDGSAS